MRRMLTIDQNTLLHRIDNTLLNLTLVRWGAAGCAVASLTRAAARTQGRAVDLLQIALCVIERDKFADFPEFVLQQWRHALDVLGACIAAAQARARGPGMLTRRAPQRTCASSAASWSGLRPRRT